MSSELIIQKVLNALDNTTQVNSINATNDIDAIKAWLLEYKNSINTFISYRQAAERFLMWLLYNQLNLKTVTRQTVLNYQDFLMDPYPSEFWCGKAKPRQDPLWKPFVKGLSNSSIKLNLQILGSLYQYLIDGGYLTKNPFRLRNIKIKTNNNLERFLTSREWDYLTNYIENLPKTNKFELQEYHRIKWIFNLLYLTGCRRSEVINAKMSDFILKRNQWWFKVVGKGNKYGEIPVPNELLANLVIYRKSLELSPYPAHTETNLPLIFSKYGKFKPISDSMLYKIIKTVARNLSTELELTDPASAYVISRLSTHWLRHTSATHQVDSGIDIRIVKENLRHSMLETTMKYQHTEADQRYNETINKFGKDK